MFDFENFLRILILVMIRKLTKIMNYEGLQNNRFSPTAELGQVNRSNHVTERWSQSPITLLVLYKKNLDTRAKAIENTGKKAVLKSNLSLNVVTIHVYDSCRRAFLTPSHVRILFISNNSAQAVDFRREGQEFF